MSMTSQGREIARFRDLLLPQPVPRREPNDIDAAAHWLYGGDPDAPGAPAWPPHDPYVIVWCPNRRKRCRIGAVYATPHGFLLVALRRGSWRKAGSRLYMMIRPDGSPFRRGLTTFQPPCRHGDTGDYLDNGQPLADVLAYVLAGKVRRPAPYTLNGQRHPSTPYY